MTRPVRRWLLVMAVAAWLSGCATPANWPLVVGQHSQSFSGVVTKKASGQFLLYLPKDFVPHGRVKYPLLIFLHGSGESGHDIEKVKINGPPKFLDTRGDFPFIVASPQAPAARFGFDFDAMNLMLNELLRQLPIDPDRVYLTGLSMGGYASYAWASQNPERFAAIAPISGAWDPEDACKLKTMPIWAFHGAKDDVVGPDGDKAMVDAIKACGGEVTYTVYPDVGHWAWDPAYADPQLYTWLLSHQRGGIKK